MEQQQPQIIITEVIFKNCSPFTDCVNEINSTQIDKNKEIDVVRAMHNSIEYSDNFLKLLEVYSRNIGVNHLLMIMSLSLFSW